MYAIRESEYYTRCMNIYFYHVFLFFVMRLIFCTRKIKNIYVVYNVLYKYVNF